jgi:hypothetical protein
VKKHRHFLLEYLIDSSQHAQWQWTQLEHNPSPTSLTSNEGVHPKAGEVLLSGDAGYQHKRHHGKSALDLINTVAHNNIPNQHNF